MPKGEKREPQSQSEPGEPSEKEKESSLNQVFMILNTDARENKHMMCQRMGDTLSFYTLFGLEHEAKIAYDQLVGLGQQPKIEGRKVFLTAQFPGEEIDELASHFNSIPEREKEGEK